ncbi:baseplate hub protein [Neopusillimonas maritima]|uniref:Transglycosylase SLT domain-containing protein n=1 Tax=Neopusillimonas maritima TaxID=2026239 RepID=A0A3A1YZM9_9BURK|nr:transglycosylase SLT domain-containing protein [Neopusillimonas maritima]RIY41944.1 hypothetical protein CJP73_00410 [Neopusillimonas maritima]
MATGINQYLRKWSMMINGEPFIDSRDGHQLRCVFDVQVLPSNTLSLADIQLYNLANSTAINQRDDITFSAGYDNQHDVIFAGTVTNVFKERYGPDVATRLLCRSGRAQERGAMASSYMPGAKLTDVLVDAARAWPLYLEIDLSQFDDKDVFPSGYSAYDDVEKILNNLKRMFDFEWTQDRGSLVITRPDKERSSTVFTVDQFSGMTGMPEVTRGPNGLGVNVTTRINPFIRTTSQIDVRSQYSSYNTGNMMISEIQGDTSANGIFNVFEIKYSGDSHGEAWDMKIEAIRAGTREVVRAADAGGRLSWGGRVDQEFRAKVREIAEKLKVSPSWLMAIMYFESRLSPSAQNKQSGATGLIQFIPSTAAGLGTSTAALKNMSAVQQLDYVYRFFAPNAGKIQNLDDAYMLVLWPRAFRKPSDYILWTEGSIEYTQNRDLDTNHDGTVTKAEAAQRVHESFKEGLNHTE